MGQVTIFSGPERRRRWSIEERLQILEEAFAPGAVVADVARRHDVSRGLIYCWRRQLCPETPSPAFLPAVVGEEPSPRAAEPSTAIVVELPDGRRVSIAASAPPALATAALKALK